MKNKVKTNIILSPPPPPRVQLDYSSLLLHLFLGVVLLFSFSRCDKNDSSPPEYTVSFDTNGGSPIDPISVQSGKTITAPDKPVKTDFVFDGWFIDEATTMPFDFNTPIVQEMILYAKWLSYKTISFDADGGSVVKSGKVIVGKKITMLPETPIKEGYFFDGWFTDETMTMPFDFDTPIEQDITLYAKWLPYKTVRFDSKGGTIIESLEVAEGKKIRAIPDKPIKEGYFFNGWFTDEAMTMPFDFDTPVEQDITLYAKWLPYKTVRFDSKGGTIIESLKVAEGKKLTAVPETPIKEGYFFDGWFTDEMTTMAFDFDTPIEQDMTLYAKWSPFTLNLKQGNIITTIVSYDIKVSVEGEELIKLEKQTVSQGNSPLDLSKTLPLPADTEALVAIDAYNANDHRVGSASQTIDTSTGANFDVPLVSRGICFKVRVDYSHLAAHILSLPEDEREDWLEVIPMQSTRDRISYLVFKTFDRVNKPDAITKANGPWTSTTYVTDLICANGLKGREIRASCTDRDFTRTHKAFSEVIDPPNEDVVEYLIELKWQGN